MEKKSTPENYPDLRILSKEECNLVSGGAEPAEGSYSLGYAIGSWFNEMYQIWSYGLTHLDER